MIFQPGAILPSSQSHGEVVAEFLKALTLPLTYSPRRNVEVLFGFLWGIPVPIFAFAIHLYASRMSCSMESCAAVLAANPVYTVFLLHPLLFAVVFGAHGTMRSQREQRIAHLLSDLQFRCDELCRSNQRLTEVDRLKSEFLANVTHELKSPLVTALGYTERVLGGHLGPVTERQARGLEVGKRNLQRLRTLIDEILDFSRLEAGVVKFAMAPTNLKDAAAIAIDNAALRARERRIAINARMPDESAAVSGDHNKLAQVCINLLDNAIKFSPDGGSVEVALARDGANWRLAITDHGKGIAADVLPKLFDRFYQADGSLSRPHNGVGLGLVVVRKIVEAHGGRVWIESLPGVATTAFVELPSAAGISRNGQKTKETSHAASPDR